MRQSICRFITETFRHSTLNKDTWHQNRTTCNLPDCQNFSRLRWPFCYFHTYRQFRVKFKSAALLKPYVRKKCSQRTVVATHRSLQHPTAAPLKYQFDVTHKRHQAAEHNSHNGLSIRGPRTARHPHSAEEFSWSTKDLKRSSPCVIKPQTGVIFSEGNADHTSARRKQWSTVKFQIVWSL
jgi:hypothetical protein